MKTFSSRLIEAMNIRELTQSELSRRSGISRSKINCYVHGRYEAKQTTLYILAKALNVSEAWLMGYDVPIDRDVTSFSARNIHPVPSFIQRPRLGTIACGEPITAEQNIETYDNVPENIKCDFTLKCKGDSMIEARIMDGDVVYIKAQPTVENGEIAAVLIGDEATLKRVYLDDNTISLLPCNSKYAPMVYRGEELNEIRIIGKAVGFTSVIV